MCSILFLTCHSCSLLFLAVCLFVLTLCWLVVWLLVDFLVCSCFVLAGWLLVSLSFIAFPCYYVVVLALPCFVFVGWLLVFPSFYRIFMVVPDLSLFALALRVGFWCPCLSVFVLAFSWSVSCCLVSFMFLVLSCASSFFVGWMVVG